MLSVEQVKQLLSAYRLTDEEARQARDELETLAEIVLDHWEEEQDSCPQEGIENKMERM